MRVYDFDYRQIIFALFMFATLGITLMVVVQIYGRTETIIDELDTWAQFTVNFFLVIFWPMLIYLAFFTRFNNPFRKEMSS